MMLPFGFPAAPGTALYPWQEQAADEAVGELAGVWRVYKPSDTERIYQEAEGARRMGTMSEGEFLLTSALVLLTEELRGAG